MSLGTAFVVASLLYLNEINFDQIGRALLALAPIVLVTNLNNRAYAIDVIAETLRSVSRGIVGMIAASLILFLVLFFLKISDEFSRAVFALGILVAIGLASFARVAAAGLVDRTFDRSPFAYLCIFDGVEPGEMAGVLALRASDINIEPRHDDPGMLDRLGGLALGMDGVVVCCAESRRKEWAFMLKSLDVATEIIVPELTDLQPLAISSRGGHASLVLGSGQLSWSQRVIKRTFDLTVVLSLLPAMVPLLALVALAIRLDSKGPVLFMQDRIGLGNRKFKILKFRTMRADALDHEAKRTTSRNDPRVTRVGNILRSTSLDELPQFINVLKGDMSIVGPRPHAEQTAIGDTLLWEIDAAYWHRHVVKPGITGLAQVRGYRGSLFEAEQLRQRLNADLEYVANWSLASDFKIILGTLNVLIHKNAF